MSVEIACAYLGALDRETFLAKVAPGLQGFRLREKIVRYDRRDIDAWVDAGGDAAQRRTDDDWLKELSDA